MVFAFVFLQQWKIRQGDLRPEKTTGRIRLRSPLARSPTAENSGNSFSMPQSALPNLSWVV